MQDISKWILFESTLSLLYFFFISFVWGIVGKMIWKSVIGEWEINSKMHHLSIVLRQNLFNSKLILFKSNLFIWIKIESDSIQNSNLFEKTVMSILFYLFNERVVSLHRKVTTTIRKVTNFPIQADPCCIHKASIHLVFLSFDIVLSVRECTSKKNSWVP